MMQQRSLEVLDYNYIRQQVGGYALCSLGKRAAAEMLPFDDLEAAVRELDAVEESLRCILRAGSPSFAGVSDIKSDLARARIGSTLSAERILAVANLIQGGRTFRQYLNSTGELFELVHLPDVIQHLFDARQTETAIRFAIDDDGQVVDRASDTLHTIRMDKRRAEGEVRTALDRLLRSQSKLLQEPIIAMRGSYFCLPVRAEHKNQIRGVVRDVSASGSTVFIEPQAVVDIGNRVRELEVLEEREVERILLELSGVIGEVADEITVNVDILQQVDIWFAKAAYARSEDAKRPQLTHGIWRLHGARHPQLDETAVPIDAELGDNFRLLIVTGPNTGGKTVTIKTIGLLTLMAMSGCFLPTQRESDIGFCPEIFVDIGDEQSIEQSLSTFSSHMKNIIHMLSAVQGDSLVLLDELGAGTDPAEGSALAISILDKLTDVGCRVVATTHYAELKGYAYHNEAAMNASMEFDVVSLRPTYRLLVGVPGRSNALLIASRLGLPEAILENAKQHVAESDMHVEELIGKLEQAQREAEQAWQEAERERHDSERLRETWTQKMAQLDNELEHARRKANEEARQTISKAQQESEKIIRELRDMRTGAGAKDHELVELRKSLERALPDTDGELRTRRGSKTTDNQRRVATGDTVRVLSLGQKGDVVDISGDGTEVSVQLGLMRLKVDALDIEIIKSAQTNSTQVHHTTRTNTKDIRMELDVRGETVDDAILRIDKYLDDAVVSGLPRVVVIHGKGTGALRNAIRRYLARHPQVKSSESGGAGEGGDGVTIVRVRM